MFGGFSAEALAGRLTLQSGGRGQAAQPFDALRVEAVGGLVQDPHVRIAQFMPRENTPTSAPVRR
jgi:hypothetical protein